MIAFWSANDTDVAFPISSLTGLSASAANGVSGDARQVAVSIMKQIFVWYNALSVKPEALTVQYRSSGVRTSGAFTGKEAVSVTIQAYVDFPSGTIAGEPS